MEYNCSLQISCLLHVSEELSSAMALQQRRDALVADDKTKEQIRQAVEKAAMVATAAAKAKKRSASLRPTTRRMRERMRLEQQRTWPSEASQPCSPTRQILRIKSQRKRREMYREVSKEDWERYERYLEIICPFKSFR